MAKLKLAYGLKEDIEDAISSGEIPPGTLILSEDTYEMFFYNLDCALCTYHVKTTFSSKEEAEDWISRYNCRGQIFSIHEGNLCEIYVVDYTNKLRKFEAAASSFSQVQVDWNETNPESPAFINNKPSQFPIEMIIGLQESLDSKVSIIGNVQTGALMVASPTGGLQCSNILPTDLVKSSDLLLGSLSSSVKIENSGEYSIPIPAEVLHYPTIYVYHNGMLLAEGFHYKTSGDSIILISYTTYEGDIFSFVGYGSTISNSNPGYVESHTHPNKLILDSITQEKVNRWDNSITIFKVNGVQILAEEGILNISMPTKAQDIGAATEDHNHDDIYVKKESLFDSNGIILSECLPDNIIGESIIEVIMLGEHILPVVDKVVTIPVATTESLGVVRSSNDANKVFVDVDGTMSIKKIDFSTLEQPEGQELILSAGNSQSLIS